MSDRELLEAAARAAGIVLAPYTWDKGAPWGERHGFTVAGGGPNEWSPLDDDGDALRLAVKLGIGLGIDMQDEIVSAYAPNPSPQHFSEDAHDADPYAATRRAIVRAAAAMAPPPSQQGDAP